MFRDFIGGASGRLLPASVPFRFFGAALVFHVLGWAGLAWAADDLPGFMGGPGPLLAALHAVTLGVATMTAMGAAFQLLPVATKRPLRSVGACKLAFWLFLPGLLVLLAGMALVDSSAMELGGGLVAAGLLVFAGLVADNLRQVRDMRVVTDHTWMAMAGLLTLGGLGLVLIADFREGFLADHQAVAAAHAVIAGYGFMGLLALGFSFILMPMFALSPQPDPRRGQLSAWLGAAALIAAAGGLIGGWPVLLWASIAAGGASVALHLAAMRSVMQSRMKTALGDSFVLIRLAWAALPAGLIVGLAAAAGRATEVTVPLWGFLLVFGWLLSLLTGVLQRIMPFLGSMFSVRPGVKPVLMSKLIAQRPLRLHLVGHCGALVLIGAGIVAGQGALVRAGALLGLAAALAYAAFGALLWRRLAGHLASPAVQRPAGAHLS